eukprot:gene10140-13641_t
MDRKPYLDKTFSLPHVPPQYGETGFVSTSPDCFPDLKHTGLKSKFERKVIPTVNPDGRLSIAYKMKTQQDISNIKRDELEFISRENVIQKGHKQFIDKILCEFEEDRIHKNKKYMKSWSRSKESLGFANSFGSLGLKGGESEESGMSVELNNLNSFDSLEQPSIISWNDDNNYINNNNNNNNNNMKSTSNNNVIPKSPRLSKKSKKLCNRMAIFNELLESPDVLKLPKKPLRRYATLSPTKTIR